MSTQSAKTARPSSKTPARTAKKSAKGAKTVKSVHSPAKKDAKTARRATGSGARRSTALGGSKTSAKAHSKSTAKVSAKVASKISAKITAKTSSEPSAQTMERMIRTLSPPVQPVASIELPVMAHKYQVGETVYFTSPSFGRAAATGSYTVVKHLPTEGDDHQYRIKSAGEAFERVAKESKLDRI
jgi:hypothetical protein